MNSQVALVYERDVSPKDGTIIIFGDQNIQNQLLSDQISKHTGYQLYFDSQIPRNGSADPSFSMASAIALLDCTLKHPNLIWEEIGLSPRLNISGLKLVLFNVEPGHSGKIENDAIGRGICGIFYTNIGVSDLFKGLQAINNGELWYTRKVLSCYLQESVRSHPHCEEVGTGLTRREKEVLKYLVAGLSNIEIADKLYLSVHTIKTHVYNLYKKIEVPNRLQAVLWAAQHMPSEYGSPDHI